MVITVLQHFSYAAYWRGLTDLRLGKPNTIMLKGV